MTAPADVLVLSCSMAEHSRSRAAAQRMRAHLEEGGRTVDWVDARELPLEWGAEKATEFGERFCRPRAAVIAFPVYDWACSARTKELVVQGLEESPRSSGRRR
jgi:NAD(P)H-dependent FMN reductase